MTKTKDWRETLFVWDGILSFIEQEEDGGKPNGKADASAAEKDDERLIWKGTWVGCDFADATEAPTPKRGAFDEFVSSENIFEVEGTVIEDITNVTKGGKKSEQGIGGSPRNHVTMTGGAGYDLGEGSDKKKHKDDRHDMYFFSPTLRWMGNLLDQEENMVLAVGENEFGNFISVGWLRVGNRVTLARRYVDEGDERAKWDINDLRRAVFDQITTVADNGHMKFAIPPWQCVAMNTDAKRLCKRQKIAKE